MQVTWTHSTHLVQHLFGFQTVLTVYSNAEKKSFVQGNITNYYYGPSSNKTPAA